MAKGRLIEELEKNSGGGDRAWDEGQGGNYRVSDGEIYTGVIGCKTKEAQKNVSCLGCSKLIFENLTWLTSDEAAVYLRLRSVGALRVLVCRGQIPFRKLGRRLRFKKVELDRFLEGSGKGFQYGSI